VKHALITVKNEAMKLFPIIALTLALLLADDLDIGTLTTCDAQAEVLTMNADIEDGITMTFVYLSRYDNNPTGTPYDCSGQEAAWCSMERRSLKSGPILMATNLPSATPFRRRRWQYYPSDNGPVYWAA